MLQILFQFMVFLGTSFIMKILQIWEVTYNFGYVLNFSAEEPRPIHVDIPDPVGLRDEIMRDTRSTDDLRQFVTRLVLPTSHTQGNLSNTYLTALLDSIFLETD